MKKHTVKCLFSLVLLLAGAVQAQVDAKKITSGGKSLVLYSDFDQFEIGAAAIVDWVQRSADIVSQYYGQFPVGNASVVLNNVAGGGVFNGRAHGQPVIQVIVNIGNHVDQRQLDRDWILVHELIHLALADVADEHRWLEEGLATYIESIARVQAGDLDEAYVWKGFMKNMPQGLPLRDDQGLDGARSIGRVYWGGALYGLLADIEIRSQSDGEFGLRDALKALVMQEMTMDKSAAIEALLALADEATQTQAMSHLYEQMKDRPTDVDLKMLWSQLGIVYHRLTGKVSFDDSKPLSAVRRAIVSP